METILKMKEIRKSFFGVEVLHGQDFEVARGEVVALCGENGAGKSTLMKILAGVYTYDSGEIEYKNKKLSPGITPLEVQNLGISMIHQELNLLEDLTVAQNIFLCREPRNRLGLIDYKKMNNDAEVLLKRLGEKINPSKKVHELKIAQKQMVEIAKAISFNVELLIMDEPTSVLTSKETEILFNLIRNLSKEGVATVYISHRLKEIVDLCETVSVLRDGCFVTKRRVSEVTVKDIATLMVGREVKESMTSDYSGSGEVVLETKNISDSMLKDISFSLRKGEILGFSGLVGAGRSELMEVIFGIRKPDSGKVYIQGKPVTIKNPIDAIKSTIGFVTEDRKDTGLVLGRDILDNINYEYWLKRRGLFRNNLESTRRAESGISKLGIRCTGHGQQVSNLSGGNQQKVVLGKWLIADAKILILDEPTRGVDVGARQEIYKVINELSKSGISIIIVSSDLPEIMSICQRVLVMHEGRLTGALDNSEMTEAKIMYYATNV
jgi:ribose transport system ATP-binding protein